MTIEEKLSAFERISEEIREIVQEYDNQIEARGYVDSPGGIEHKGDAFRLLRRWDAELNKDNQP